MTNTPVANFASNMLGETYNSVIEQFEAAKLQLGKRILNAIEANNGYIAREYNQELFELIDVWQLDDAYILVAMEQAGYNATLHSHRNRTGTRYENLSYEITF